MEDKWNLTEWMFNGKGKEKHGDQRGEMYDWWLQERERRKALAEEAAEVKRIKEEKRKEMMKPRLEEVARMDRLVAAKKTEVAQQVKSSEMPINSLPKASEPSNMENFLKAVANVSEPAEQKAYEEEEPPKKKKRPAEVPQQKPEAAKVSQQKPEVAKLPQKVTDVSEKSQKAIQVDNVRRPICIHIFFHNGAGN